MINFNRLNEGKHKSYQLPIVESENGVIHRILPYEIFINILSFLDDQSSIIQVSRFWNEASIYIIKRREYHLINKFIEDLSKHLDKTLYPTQIEKLYTLSRGSLILNSTTLIEVKYSVSKLKNEIIDILKSLTENDLNILKNLIDSKPCSYENIFDLTKLYKKNR